MNIYIHIPFCAQKCTYCKFAITPIFSEYHKKKYLHALKSEIRAWLEKYSTRPIETLYFWGGTPSLLSLEEIADILTLFDVASIREISFESNPEDLNEAFLSGLFALGINRLSLGVQSLNDHTLRSIERKPKNTIFSALNSIKTLSVWKVWNSIYEKNRDISINIDMILWLPHTKSGEISSSIQRLHADFPEITHTSVYILEKGHYPASWQEYSIDDDAISREYLEICDFFREQWWHHYEVSNFAKPGYECSHNQWYWNHTETLGFGLSASGLYRDWDRLIRRSNAASFSGYYRYEYAECETLTPADIHLEKFLFWLRTTEWWHMHSDFPLNHDFLDAAIAAGYATKTDSRLFITERGWLLIDHIIEWLLEWASITPLP